MIYHPDIIADVARGRVAELVARRGPASTCQKGASAAHIVVEPSATGRRHGRCRASGRQA